MKTDQIIQHLETNRLVYQAMLTGKEPNEYQYRPDDTSWSILEIVCHLYDEEREDFRARVKNALESPHLQAPSIDPPGWVKQRKYAEQNYAEKLEAFLQERKSSILWLKELKNAPWDNIYEHPLAGKISAYAFLANWLAHDYHHIRQINRRLYELLKATGEVSLAYAGDW